MTIMKRMTSMFKTGYAIILFSLFLIGITTETKSQVMVTGPMQLHQLIDTMYVSNMVQLSPNYIQFTISYSGVVGAPCPFTIDFGVYPSSSNIGTTMAYTITSNGSGTVTGVTSVNLPSDTISMVLNANNGSVWGITSPMWFVNPISTSCSTTITAGGPTTICQGDSVKFVATGDSTYLWSPATGLNTTTGATVIASPTATTTYTVTGTNGTCTASSAVTVTVNSVPAPQISGNTNLGCSSSVILTASGGLTYKWSSGQTTDTINVTTAGTYVVTATNSCGSDTASVVVTNSGITIPVTLDTSGTITLCQGNSITINTSSISGSSFKWYQTGSSTILSTNTYLTISTVGNYYCMVTFGNCSGTSNTVIIAINTPSVSAGNDVTICSGNSTTLTATGWTSYTWLPTTGLSASTGTSVTATPVSTTTYIVSSINNYGCIATDNVTITVSSGPSLTVCSNQTICAGSSVQLSANAGSGVNYTWLPASSLDDQNLPNPTATPTSTTTYTVVADNGCTASASAVITVDPLPNIISVQLNGTILILNGIGLGEVSQVTIYPSQFVYYPYYKTSTVVKFSGVVLGSGDDILVTTNEGCQTTYTYSPTGVGGLILEGKDDIYLREHEQISLFDINGGLIEKIISSQNFSKENINEIDNLFKNQPAGIYLLRSSGGYSKKIPVIK